MNLVAGLGTVLVAAPAFAGGLEKGIMWSGKYAGFGNAGVAISQDAESLYFNPAGLAAAQGIQVSGNISPTWDRFNAPLAGDGSNVSTGWSFAAPGAAMASYQINDQLGVGIGWMVTGGTNADFSNIGYDGYPLTADWKSQVAITEFSVGAGYEIIQNLRIGAAWRLSHVGGNLSFAQINNTPIPNVGTLPVLTTAHFDNIGQTRWNGFRVGGQYGPRDGSYGFGVDWRTAVTFNADSDVTTQSALPSVVSPTAQAATTQKGKLGLEFPSAIDAGGFYAITPELKALFQFGWTNYSVDQTLNTSLENIALGWSNQQAYRFGLIWGDLKDLQLRGGYTLTTAVTASNGALPNISSPGNGQTFTVGAGKGFAGMWEVNGAVEYSYASGDGTSPLASGAGTYRTKAIVAHLGVDVHI